MEAHRTDAILSRREREVAACIVEGLTLKQTANRLCVVYQCIANHTQSIYDKAGIFDHRTLNALTAWWFRTNFDLKDASRKFGASCLLLLFCAHVFGGENTDQMVRRARRGRRSEYELIEK